MTANKRAVSLVGLIVFLACMWFTAKAQEPAADAPPPLEPTPDATPPPPLVYDDLNSFDSLTAQQESTGGPVIRVYQNCRPLNTKRDEDSILSLGKSKGVDYFVHPLEDLQNPVPGNTAVVFVPTAWGCPRYVELSNMFNSPDVQGHLEQFVRAGGVLVADLAEDLFPETGGFQIPGATGTTAGMDYSVYGDTAELASACWGADGIEHTADDHPLCLGPDMLPNTADDLNNDLMTPYGDTRSAFGDLGNPGAGGGTWHEGIDLPNDATVLATDLMVYWPTKRQARLPIVAEYCLDAGLVIADTVLKEYWLFKPVCPNPSNCAPPTFMRNLLAYALGPASTRCVLPVDIDIKPDSDVNSINLGSAGVIPVAILSTPDFDAPNETDPDSLKLAGATVNLIGRSSKFQCGSQDVNEDSLLDYLCHFETQTLFMLEPGDTTAVLEGTTTTGRKIRGTDSVNIVP